MIEDKNNECGVLVHTRGFNGEGTMWCANKKPCLIHMKYKEFNWETTGRSKEVVDFLRNVQNMKISEEQFSRQLSALPRTKRRVGVNPGRHRSPSSGKAMYRRLKRDFGFFQ